MTRLPEALFILDARTEKTAVREAKSVHVPVVALVDSNVNPVGVKYVIPGNDDATASLELISSLVAEAVKEGRAKAVNARAAVVAATARSSAEDDVKVSDKSKEVVEELNDKVKEELAKKARVATKA